MSPFLKALQHGLSRFNRAEIPVRAAALAYHTLLSIIPILGLVFWYLQRIRLTEYWLRIFRDFINQQLNVSSSAVFVKYFDQLTRSVQSGSWGWVGLAVFLYTAFNLVRRFGQSIDIVLGTSTIQPETEINPWKLGLRRVLAMLLLPVAILAALALTNWIERDSWLHVLFRLHTVGPFFALPLAWAGEIIAVFLVYLLIPRNRVPWREAMRAALIVAPASEGIRLVFGIYNHHAVSTYRIYGVLAVAPLFILWVQIAWMVLLSGTMLIRFSGGRGKLAQGD